jgi:hypothetical protein
MPRLPNVSVVFKLYAILVLLATVTVMLAAVAVWSAHRRTVLTSEFEAALQGAQNVERINSLIYAVAMESRGLYLAADAGQAREWASRIMRANDELSPTGLGLATRGASGAGRGVSADGGEDRSVLPIPKGPGSPRHG